MKEKKVRQHKITDKNPYISSILLVIVGFFILSLVSGVLNVIIAIPVPDYPRQYGPIGLLVGLAAGLLFYKLWFKGEFTSFFRYGKIGPGVQLIVVYMIYLALSLAYDAFEGDVSFKFNVSGVLTALYAGVIEEFMFRGIMTSTLMRKRKNKDSIMIQLLFPALLFGFIHLTNAFSGADILVAFFQSLGSAAVGMALGAIYILTGNLAVVIAIHTFHDVIAICFSNDVSSSGVMTGSVTAGTIIELILAIGMFVYVVYYAKKQKNIDIARDLWDKKWTASL
ncbi:CPBP family intramembrane glutamic endopeptidase [Butyrivibrio sp. FCS006]|uniref:CPBP family intramembrane glutamic endopeptidase n=1 Tax=Butyrivibrio sp. FCS006 TaxID=1280684 RepID=UPI0003FDA33F|nr:type II CAAX endopeptidase family protein [Butyrivibrio sp. FCS006]